MTTQMINNPELCVDEFISGLVQSNSGLVQLPGHRVVLRKDLFNLKGKVALFSGGGSGHEPAHAGFVGRGMLSGAISGSIFTSPPPSSIFAAIKALSRYQPQGVIIIFKNYTGDRINFGLAREWAMNEGIKVEMVIVAEDCAFESSDRSAGKRGLAGTVFLHKIGGAMAENGESFEAIYNTLLEISEHMGTIGVCLKPCVLPGSTVPSFELEEGEMELGLGIHGEAGVKRVGKRSASDTVQLMIDHMTDPKSASHLRLDSTDELAVLVNNLGGLSILEMGVITNDVAKNLSARGYKIRKIFAGTYVSSLQMVGFSISILKINNVCPEVPIISLFEMETDVAAPLRTVNYNYDNPEPDLKGFERVEILSSIKKEPKVSPVVVTSFKHCVISSCKALLSIKDRLNDLDRGSGDGDCGNTHVRGAEGVLAEMEKGDFSCPAKIFQRIGLVCSEMMGGSSGAMYSVLMAAVARQLAESEIFNLISFSKALNAGVKSVEKYGGARLGDRTMVDVLRPISDKISSSNEANLRPLCQEVSDLAQKYAKATAQMKARAGRASYVSQDLLVNPDPGAVAVAEVISICAKVLLNH